MTLIENARRARAGAVSLKFGDFNTQHTRTTDKTQFQRRVGGQRFERQIARVHALGPRPLAEMIAEIATATGEPGLIADRVEAYAALDPEIVRAVGADCFPPSVLGGEP